MLEKQYIRKDGELVWVNLNVSLIYDLFGKAQYTLALIEDISDRKQDETERQRMEVTLREKQQFIEKVANANPNIIHSRSHGY